MKLKSILLASLFPAMTLGMFWGVARLKNAGDNWMEKKAKDDPLFAIFKENKERLDDGLPPLQPDEVPQDIRKVYQNYFEKEVQRYERNKFSQEED
ncbi:hypothetical protein C9374_005216 [Naegleria lovaniensis]|uniref:Uncharacterized protein n=1 Tax=Naegleria lovaniensis TaxID=51637 RepID=A0AA88GKH0_NAELO|nr:uncharacterized protein C9374_005216 [Naegleria lovaniensis]KAG2382636.1 hypothetical protein C9374_005216 [Naegleria lovaniensis]